MAEKKYSIVVIGQLTLDDIVRFDGRNMLDSTGGAGMFALGGAYMWRQERMGFVTRKGYDFDLDIVKNAASGQIDLSGVVEVDSPNIHIWNMFDRKGHRYFINQRWAGKDDNMAPILEDIPKEYMDGAEAFLITSYPLPWQSQVIRSMPDDAIVMVDPHFDWIYPDKNELWYELFKKITIFVPSEEELIRFFGIKVKDEIYEYIPYLKKISEKGPQVVCVKLGANGALAYDRSRDMCWHVPAYKTEIVDVTGCGDAFCGGFLSSYVKDRDVYKALVCGCISSSFNIEHIGSLENFKVPFEKVLARYDEFINLNERKQCTLVSL